MYWKLNTFTKSCVGAFQVDSEGKERPINIIPIGTKEEEGLHHRKGFDLATVSPYVNGRGPPPAYNGQFKAYENPVFINSATKDSAL